MNVGTIIILWIKERSCDLFRFEQFNIIIFISLNITVPTHEFRDVKIIYMYNVRGVRNP